MPVVSVICRGMCLSGLLTTTTIPVSTVLGPLGVSSEEIPAWLGYRNVDLGLRFIRPLN